MFVTRILNIAVLLLAAVAILLPRPGVNVKPAITRCEDGATVWCLGEMQRARVAELQASLLGSPGDADMSLELGRLFLDAKQPDWALATARAGRERHPDDHRLWTIEALAHADRFDAAPAYEAAHRAFLLCDAPTVPAGAPICGEASRARLALLDATLHRVRDLDMRKQPHVARERIFEALHPAWVPRPGKGTGGKGGAAGAPTVPAAGDTGPAAGDTGPSAGAGGAPAKAGETP